MSDWRDEARCLNNPIPWDTPDPDDRGPTKLAREAAAKNICNNHCTVVNECLADALAHEGPSNAFNIRGGMTADERKALLRAEARKRDLQKKRERRAEEKTKVAA